MTETVPFELPAQYTLSAGGSKQSADGWAPTGSVTIAESFTQSITVRLESSPAQ